MCYSFCLTYVSHLTEKKKKLALNENSSVNAPVSTNNTLETIDLTNKIPTVNPNAILLQSVAQTQIQPPTGPQPSVSVTSQNTNIDSTL